MFALICVPRLSIRRGGGQADLAIHFGGITFHPGDHVYADANGIIVAANDIT